MRTSVSTLVIVSLVGATLVRAEGAGGRRRRPLKVVVAQGYDVVSRIENPRSNFRTLIGEAFSRDAVEALPKRHTTPASSDFYRSALLTSFQYADIYYLTIHGIVPPFNQMHSVRVAPSEDNKDLSPKGNHVATADVVRRSLLGRRGPTLVVFNGCQLADPNDGVPTPNRMSTAFGIKRKTKGRAFIGWDWSIVGVNQEVAFGNMFRLWTTPGPNGTYPTIGQAVLSTQWAKTKPPRIVGDDQLRYTDVQAGPQPKGRKASISASRENEVDCSKGKVTHWKWDLKIAESEGVGVRITEMHLFGWRGSVRQNMPNAVTRLDIRIEPLGEYISKKGHIQYTRRANPKDDGRLKAVYYGIDDNGHYVSTELNTVVRPTGNGKTRLEY